MPTDPSSSNSLTSNNRDCVAHAIALSPFPAPSPSSCERSNLPPARVPTVISHLTAGRNEGAHADSYLHGFSHPNRLKANAHAASWFSLAHYLAVWVHVGCAGLEIVTQCFQILTKELINARYGSNFSVQTPQRRTILQIQSSLDLIRGFAQ
ncbi:hypothetical protein BC826DRAFT_736015 [Russula brevipes]|nr:hypothetical protein BC826DRAFT_736015 [Russula brevipes]